jgi:hypothetical protein
MNSVFRSYPYEQFGTFNFSLAEAINNRKIFIVGFDYGYFYSVNTPPIDDRLLEQINSNFN